MVQLQKSESCRLSEAFWLIRVTPALARNVPFSVAGLFRDRGQHGCCPKCFSAYRRQVCDCGGGSVCEHCQCGSCAILGINQHNEPCRHRASDRYGRSL